MRRGSPRGSALAVAAVAFLGCGGSDAPSRQEFAVRADAICRQTGERLDQEAASTGGPEFVQQIARAFDDQQLALSALDPPAGGRDDLDRLLAALDDQVALARDVPDIEKSRLARTGRFLAASRRAAREAQRAAETLGLRVCGRQ